MSCKKKCNHIESIGVQLGVCELGPETTRKVTVNLNRATLDRLQKLEPETPIERLIEDIIESFDW